MIHILLIILKIIGILLLVILGLLLLLLLCILFVPISYNGKIRYDTKHREVHFKAKYLLGLIRLRADISGKDISYSVRILFKKIISSQEDEDSKEKKKKKRNKNSIREQTSTENLSENKKSNDNTGNSIAINTKDDFIKKDSSNIATDRADTNNNNNIATDRADTNKNDNNNIATHITDANRTDNKMLNSPIGNKTQDKLSSDRTATEDIRNHSDTINKTVNESNESAYASYDKNRLVQLYHRILNYIIRKINVIVNIKNRIVEFIVNIKSKIINFLDKLRDINKRKQEYLEFLGDKRSKEAIRIIKDLLLDTGKHIIPKKIKGKLKFGTGSPDTTGKSLGIISLFCNNYLKKVKIEADFDNKVFEADIKFKGRIRGIIILVNAIKLYRVKRLREFINFVRK